MKIKIKKAVYIDSRGYFKGETYDVDKKTAEAITKAVGKDAFEKVSDGPKKTPKDETKEE